MPSPRLLVVEGNTAETRDRHRSMGGTVTGEGYAALLGRLAPGAVVDICFPTDAGANLPDGRGLEGYDGIAITGSALNIYDGGPAIAPQVELARTALTSGTPIFGSCWGLQVLTVAAGGSVRRNPLGREIGFARRIAVTAAGRGHRMFAGKGSVFDALAVHLDEVETLAPGTTVLARNDMSEVQAAEIRVNGTVAWGVQYHPEYSCREMAAIVRRYGGRLIDDGLFETPGEIEAFAADLDRLHADPGHRPLAWRYGVDGCVLDETRRTMEIANWITHQVMPTRARRGRG
jgi:GMP synthase (glutamine-hydrolysing)